MATQGMWLNNVLLLLARCSCMHKLDWKLQSWEFMPDLGGVHLCHQLSLEGGVFSEKWRNAFHVYGWDKEPSEVLWTHFVFLSGVFTAGKVAKSGSCKGDQWKGKGLGWSPVWRGGMEERQRWLILSLKVLVSGSWSTTAAGMSARHSTMVSGHAS